MELGYQPFPSLRHLWMLSRLVPVNQTRTFLLLCSFFIFILKISKQLGGGGAESTDGFATTTAASLVRAKDDSGFVKWYLLAFPPSTFFGGFSYFVLLI
jgi:hypothetical protein